MVRNICKDEELLKIPSREAKIGDVSIGNDLLETLKKNSDKCVGMAANMIGESVNIIVFLDDNKYEIMYNPSIVKFSDKYEAEEGCLSLTGTRKVIRYKKIKVCYNDESFKNIRYKTYEGFTAEIIQHEIDHLKGIII